MRKRIFEIIEAKHGNDTWSKVYDIFMIGVIFMSIMPLIVRDDSIQWVIVDRVCATVFIVDYILRFSTADYKFPESKHPFLRYPFSAMAIIDLVSILPSITRLNNALQALRMMRLLRILRVFGAVRIFKTARYSRHITVMCSVIKNTKESLITVFGTAVAYVFVSALIVFNVEPDTFGNFFTALYWATISLLTIGYGDIVPVTEMGRFITMISSVVGIAIIALPSSILTAGYMAELDRKDIIKAFGEAADEEEKKEQEKQA